MCLEIRPQSKALFLSLVVFGFLFDLAPLKLDFNSFKNI